MSTRADRPTPSPQADGAPAEESPPADVALLGAPTEDGAGLKVLRRRADRLEAGELRPVRDGMPLHGDLVTLRPRPEHDRLFDVEVHHAGPRPEPRDGPSRVASSRYRSGWESIWGGDAPDGSEHETN